MLRCAVLSLCAGTAFRITRNPCLCSPLGIGAGPILIAGCGGKLSASFSKKACRSGYNVVIFFLSQFLLRKDLRGKFQLSRLRNIAQFLRLLVRLQQRAFSSLNYKPIKVFIFPFYYTDPYRFGASYIPAALRMELTAESRDAISGAARPPQNSSILRQQSLGGRSYPAPHHLSLKNTSASQAKC